jgi:AcrR family transcriptional regulator
MYLDAMSSDNSETRDRILDAAWTLLEERAGGGVRMSDIARQAGISRQAVYLHFPTRAELLVALTRHIDRVKDTDKRLEASRSAAGGLERLDAFIDAWGNYIPEIHGVARALIAMKDTDEAAAAAWDDRMQAVRHGCKAAVKALDEDGLLRPENSLRQSTDILWTLLSVANWEQLTGACGWTQSQYIDAMKSLARAGLLSREAGRHG